MTDRVTYRATATYHVPETDKQKALRIALKKPPQYFSFIVERHENDPAINPTKIRAHSNGA